MNNTIENILKFQNSREENIKIIKEKYDKTLNKKKTILKELNERESILNDEKETINKNLENLQRNNMLDLENILKSIIDKIKENNIEIEKLTQKNNKINSLISKKETLFYDENKDKITDNKIMETSHLKNIENLQKSLQDLNTKYREDKEKITNTNFEYNNTNNTLQIEIKNLLDTYKNESMERLNIRSENLNNIINLHNTYNHINKEKKLLKLDIDNKETILKEKNIIWDTLLRNKILEDKNVLNNLNKKITKEDNEDKKKFLYDNLKEINMEFLIFKSDIQKEKNKYSNEICNLRFKFQNLNDMYKLKKKTILPNLQLNSNELHHEILNLQKQIKMNVYHINNNNYKLNDLIKKHEIETKDIQNKIKLNQENLNSFKKKYIELTNFLNIDEIIQLNNNVLVNEEKISELVLENDSLNYDIKIKQKKHKTNIHNNNIKLKYINNELLHLRKKISKEKVLLKLLQKKHENDIKMLEEKNAKLNCEDIKEINSLLIN
jgi:hypothetical protein